MSDEQRVRTMCGWIGVEISRSRVRTPGKAGYGLYRVRGSRLHIEGGIRNGRSGSVVTRETWSEWTPYAFRLQDVRTAVGAAIERGAPEGPGEMVLPVWPELVPVYRVPTRWTQQYRGRRDLGERGGRLCGRPQRHEDECVCLADGNARWLPDGPDEVSTRPAPVGEGSGRDTVRTRQRVANAAFQAEHAPRRAAGLERRHAAKLSRGERRDG